MLLVKRALWDLVIDSHRDLVDDRADYAAAAKSLWRKTLRVR